MKFVLALLMVVATIGWSSGNNSEDYSINLKLVRTIGKSMDTEANPCTDFHEYACGKWESPEYLSAITKLKSDVSLELIRYMDDTHLDDMPEFVKKVYEFYTSCTDTDNYGESKFLDLMEKYENMKWALLASSEDSDADFDWVRSLGVMRRYGMNGIFLQEAVRAKSDDPSKMLFELKKPVGESAFVKLDKYNFDRVMESLKLPTQEQLGEDFWKEIVEFEDKLVKLDEIKGEASEKLITVKEISLPWLNEYLGVILDKTVLDSNMELYVENFDYLEALHALLKNYDNKFICRYLEVLFVKHLSSGITTSYNEVCMEWTKDYFPLATHWIYEYLHPELEKEIPIIEQMFGNILEHANQTLRSEKYGSVPEKFLNKLNNMQVKIGNLPRADTIKVLDSFYAPLKLSKSNIYDNQLQVLKFKFNAAHSHTARDLKLNIHEYFNELESYNMDWWVMEPYYLPVENVIVFPAELLRQPLYHWGYEDIFKYSSIGTILTRYIYDDLKLEGLSKNDEDEKYYASLSTTADIVFKSFSVELEEKHYPIHEKLMSMKKLYFLEAAQYFCEGNMNKNVHDMFARIPQFEATFECSHN